ncbi:hypothetical protein M5U04_20450 [Xenorhabdus sp. XENO-1]|uniref:hypothetical protein n=1 Tax=Xenorhabdus bovienii TaxID=40576 RepID=UPI0020CA3065|nr:hypothetical protein [Xenorhabdus bovienii]MCP9270377.1 hypothetical protein [Xenorhabdus bovienii subsp. africana]
MAWGISLTTQGMDIRIKDLLLTTSGEVVSLSVPTTNKKECSVSKQNDIQTFPIAGVEIRTVEAYDALIFTPQYIVSPIDPTVYSDKNFIVSREIAKQLIEMLQNGIHKLESSSPSVPESEKN